MTKWILYGLVLLVGLVLLLFAYGSIKNRIQRNKQMKIFNTIFTNNQFTKPTIEFGFSYWWPTFKLTFESLADFDIAKKLGLLKKFENEIGDIYGPPFESEQAITYLYQDKNNS